MEKTIAIKNKKNLKVVIAMILVGIAIIGTFTVRQILYMAYSEILFASDYMDLLVNVLLLLVFALSIFIITQRVKLPAKPNKKFLKSEIFLFFIAGLLIITSTINLSLALVEIAKIRLLK
jgi:hypothetical protein